MTSTVVASVVATVVATVLLASLGALWRQRRELLRDLRVVVLDMKGEPARPGRDAVPPLGAQVREAVELAKATRDELHGVVDQLAALSAATSRTRAQLADVDHRNAQQVELLRDELHARLDQLADDALRAEVYRAALTELGIDADPPPPPTRGHRP